MKLSRLTCQPNSRPFQMTPVKRLFDRYPAKKIIDPFPYPYQRDALEYLKSLPYECADRIDFDPPYTLRQLKEVYDGLGIALSQHETQHYWQDLNREIFRILKPGGICIKFGYNTSKIHPSMEIIEQMNLCHGGPHHDTLITVQFKGQVTLRGKGNE